MSDSPPQDVDRPGNGRVPARVLTALTLLLVAVVGAWWLWLTAHGGHLFMVETPSMARTAPVGTLVVTERVDPAALRVGDVITFRPSPTSKIYTHRIIEITAKGLRTQGDLNSSPDGWVVPTSGVVGRAAHLWFGLGWLLKMVPWLALGGFVTALAARWCHDPVRASALIVGSSLTTSLALIIVRPLVRAETIGFVPDGPHAVKISAVSTGLLPIRATSLDGRYVDLVAGELGWVSTAEADAHGRFQLVPALHLPWWGWVLVALFCALPLIASLLVRSPDDEEHEPPPSTSAHADGPLRRGPVGRAPAAVASLLAAAGLVVGVSPTSSALTARITNATDTARSRTFFTCKDAMQYYQGTSRNAQLIVGYAGGDGTGLPGTTSLATKSSSALSPVNTVQTTSVGCVTDYTARGQKALTLDGSTSKLNISMPPSQSLVDADPQNSNRQAIQVWFRTSTTSGGVLGCLATSSSVCSGRTLFMRNDGHVVWGVGSASTIASSTALNDGRWHMAVGQLHSTTGMELWIDGALVASNSSVTSSDGNVVYPQWGYSSGALPSGFGPLPTSLYFAGDMQFVGLYGGWNATGGLQDSDVKNLYEAGLP